jgi:hypothetical protein
MVLQTASRFRTVVAGPVVVDSESFSESESASELGLAGGGA